MTTRLTTSGNNAFASLTPLDRLCDAVAANDMGAFDQMLEQVADIDAQQHRALLACMAHDRFAMARKIFLRGAASTLLLKKLENDKRAASSAYSSAHSAHLRGRKPSCAQEHAAHLAATNLYNTLATWKESFEKDTLALLPLQRIQELEDKIDALRQELAQVLAPRHTLVKKAPPAIPDRGTPSC